MIDLNQQGILRWHHSSVHAAPYYNLKFLRLHMQDKPLVFGYWKMRGKGHILRMVLEYCHLPYQQVVFCSPQSFLIQRKEIAHLAHNLPFLQDGEVMIFDLMPAFIYIAKKYGREELIGKTIKDQAIVDMYHWDIQYLFKKLICNTFWSLSEEEKVVFQQKMLRENVQPILQKFESVISPTSGWYLDYLSCVDFSIFELNSYIDQLFPGKMEAYPKIRRIVRNVMQIPEVQELQKSPKMKELCFLPTEMCKKGRKLQS